MIQTKEDIKEIQEQPIEPRKLARLKELALKGLEFEQVLGAKDTILEKLNSLESLFNSDSSNPNFIQDDHNQGRKELDEFIQNLGEILDNQWYGDDPARYIEIKNLESRVNEIVHQIKKVFGEDCEPTLTMFGDCRCESMLMIQIPVKSLQESDRLLNQFCYDWWYNQPDSREGRIGITLVRKYEN